MSQASITFLRLKSYEDQIEITLNTLLDSRHERWNEEAGTDSKTGSDRCPQCTLGAHDRVPVGGIVLAVVCIALVFRWARGRR